MNPKTYSGIMDGYTGSSLPVRQGEGTFSIVSDGGKFPSGIIIGMKECAL
jgi:hypothetical protein